MTMISMPLGPSLPGIFVPMFLPDINSGRRRRPASAAVPASGAAAATLSQRPAEARADRRARWLLATTSKTGLARIGAWAAATGLGAYGVYALAQHLLQHGATAASSAAAAAGACAPAVGTVAASKAMPLAAIIGIAVGATLAAIVLGRLAWLGVRHLRARAQAELAARQAAGDVPLGAAAA